MCVHAVAGCRTKENQKALPLVWRSSYQYHALRSHITDETAAEDDSLNLPLKPDDGIVLILDDEQVVNVAS